MKQITQVKCIFPFTWLTVHHHGYCYSCCPAWIKMGNVGNINQVNSIMQIWNSERMQYIRKAILEDQLPKVCNFKFCPIANQNQFVNLETLKNNDQNFNRLIDQIMVGRTILDNPPHTFQVANSGKCNLNCIMCLSNDKCLQYDDRLDEKLFTKIIPEILPEISLLSLTGNGEVLFNPYSRKFLQTLDSTRYPSLKIELCTNGTLLNPRLWESIRHIRYESIYVSVDAASKETYEKIRKNGKWDILRRNLDLIAELRRQKIFPYFGMNFCVMKSNYQEMKDYVKLGLELGCDRIYFQKMFGLANPWENINFTTDPKIFREIAGILSDPLFSHPNVNTTAIDDYREYRNDDHFGWDGLSKVKEWLFCPPTKAIISLAKFFPFLTDFYELLRKKAIPVNFRKEA